MMWVKVSEKKPEIGMPVLIVSPGKRKTESFLKSHKRWNEQNLKPCSLSYWWDGVENFDIAVTKWYAIYDTDLILIFDEEKDGVSN